MNRTLASYDRGIMPPVFRFLLPLLLLCFAARAEFPVSDERPLAPTLGLYGNVRVVATDRGILAFWTTTTSYGSDGLLQLARMSHDGALERRATAWEIPTFLPFDAASNGERVVLAGSCSYGQEPFHCLAQFSAAGDFLGHTQLPYPYPIRAAVASDGDGFLVILATSRPRWEIAGVPVSSNGEFGDPVVLTTISDRVPWRSPTATAIGSTYYSTYHTENGPVLARINGLTITKSVELSSAFAEEIAVESSGDRLLAVATTPWSPSADRRLRFSLFDAALNQTTAWAPLDGQATPRIAPTADGWIVASRTPETTLVAVSRSGEAGAGRTVEPSWDYDVAGGTRIALVSGHLNNEPFLTGRVRFSIHDASGAELRAPVTISVGPAPQIQPAAAHAGGVTLTAWTEATPEGTFAIRTRPFDGAGTPLAPPAAIPSRGTFQTIPRVATDGSSFFVAWSEGASVYGARVARDGRVLDPEGIRISDSSGAADVDWSGTAWIVVAGDREFQIVATRISPGGIVLDTTPVPVAPKGEQPDYDPLVDCTGQECLVVWRRAIEWQCRFDPCIPPSPQIFGRRVAPDVTPLDPSPVHLKGDYDEVYTLVTSWNPTEEAWLVAWSPEGRQRVTRDGRLLDTHGPQSPYGEGIIAAMPEGDGWRVAWAPQSSGDVFHGWSPTGRVTEVRERHALVRSPHREWNPVLVEARRPLALFLRESQITAGSPQLFGRFLDESELLSTELVLRASRIDALHVRLSWSTAIDDVRHVQVQRFDRYWKWVTMVTDPSTRFVDVDLPEGNAARFRIIIGSPSGPIESNVVDIPGARRRTVLR